MDPLSTRFLIWAVALGAISAVSLPLGSIVGLQTRPRYGLISMLAAFGAGALIAALSVELVAPTVFALGESDAAPHHGDAQTSFLALVVGAVVGGTLFVLLDQLINAHGGFLRHSSSTIAYFTARRRRQQVEILEELAGFPWLEDLSPDHVNALLAMIRPVEFQSGKVIARQGDPGSELIFVVEGGVDAMSETGLETRFEAGSVMGMIPVIMGVPHPGSLTARERVVGYSLSRSDAERLRQLSPSFDLAARALTKERLEELEQLIAIRDAKSMDWLRQAGHALSTGTEIPDALQLRQAVAEHKGAPLAIWLGILIDGIPESFVIGAGLLVVLQSNAQAVGTLSFAGVVPYTLIAGLFLSNFPEALASSANMRHQGWAKSRIFLLWLSLMVITAAGAGVGFLIADSLSHAWLIFAEGLAAGAMLTMIAAAMIPEAVHMGKADAVGLATLAGFLAAISFKLLE